MVNRYDTAMDTQRPRVVKVMKKDYNQVMAIASPAEIYGGTDYLPDYFNMLIDSPNAEAYAMAIGDKFVSFGILKEVDGGLTKVSGAVRTHRDYAGRGYTGMIMKHLETSPSYKKPIYIAFTQSIPVQQDLSRIEAGLWSKIMIMDNFEFMISKVQLKECLLKITNLQDASLIRLDRQRLANLLGQQYVCQHLFPEGRVIVDWVPYRLMKSNADLIMTERTTAIISGTEIDSLLLTFGNYFHAMIGFIYNLEVYGHKDRIENHLVEHFKKILASAVTNKIFIRFFAREKTEWDKTNEVMKKFGFEKTSIWGRGLVCKEMRSDGSKL